MPVVQGFRTTIQDPKLVRRYRDFIKGSATRATTASEKELTRLLDRHKGLIGSSLKGKISRTGAVKSIPSFTIKGEQLEGAVATAFGQLTPSASVINSIKKQTSTNNLVNFSDASFKIAVQSENSEDIIQLFDQGRISDKARNAFFKGGARIFRIIKSDSNLFNLFYRHSKNLQIVQLIGKRVEVFNLSFSKSAFKFQPYSARLRGNTISIFLLDKAEKKLVSDIQKTQALVMEGPFTEFDNQSNRIQKGKVKPVNLSGSIQSQYFSGSSIPMSSATINIPKRVKKAEKERFVSDAQLTSILQGLMRRQMPQGPIGGPPLSDEFLTIRTGRYLKSAEIIADYKSNVMRYKYNPIYMAHIPTGRNPDRQIEGNIRQMVQRLFGEQFKIIRAM